MPAPAELPERPALVGREAEFETLRSALDAAVAGRGSTVLLWGEAGIGKTRLLDELRALAGSRGVRTMSGTCFAENLTPYIAYAEAFREGGLEFLFAQEAVRVDAAFLVDKHGILLAKAERAESPLDPDIFTAMLQAVENFVRDSLERGADGGGALNVLGYGDHRILVEQGTRANLVAILTGKENEFLLADLKEVLAGVEARFGEVLAGWDGDMEKVRGCEEPLRALLVSDKYEGLDPAKADPEVRRNRLFENIALGLVREAKRAPILLCLDDLQWADATSLALTHYVSRNAREAGLLIVGTYRSEDLQTPAAGQKHPLVETMQLMSREGLYIDLRLPRLGPEDVGALVRALLGAVEFPEDFDPGVFKESGGNPFYLLEIVRLMVAEGVLRREAGVWRFTRPLSEVDLPPRIQHVVLRRVQRLPAEDRDLLDLAAVIGEAFAPDLLARAAGKEKVPLLKALRPLEQEHQLLRSAEEGYRFDHAKVREVVYAEIPEPLRREYHGLVGVALEQLHGQDLDAVLADLAHHFFQARNRIKGVQYAVRAGDHARILYANEEAVRFFDQALELMGADTKWAEQRLALLEIAGDLQDLLGRFDGALRSYATLLESGPDAETRARMHRKRGSIRQRRGDYPKAEDDLFAAEAALGERSAELGRIKLWRGRLQHRRGDYGAAAVFLTEAAALFEEFGGDDLDTAEALDSLAFVHWVRQEVPEARRHWERSVQVRQEMDDQKGLRAAHNNLANTYAAVRDWENALRHYHESLKIAEKIGDRAGAVKPLTNIGRTHQLLGRREEAIAAYGRALKTTLRVGDQRGVASLNLNLASLHEDQGDLPRADEHYRRCLEMAERLGEKLLVAGAAAGLGSLAVKRADIPAARTRYERALELFRAVNVPDDIVYTEVLLGWLALRAGDHEVASAHLAEAETVSVARTQGHVGAALDGLRGARLWRRGEDGEPLLRSALAQLPRSAAFEHIRVRWDLGELLRERNPAEAGTFLREARDIAVETGDRAAAEALAALLPPGG